MEGFSRNEEGCHLLDLIPKGREWLVKIDEGKSHGSSEEKKLGLRLGPPGDQDWSVKDNTNKNSREESLPSLEYFSSMASMNNSGSQTQKLGQFSTAKNHTAGAVLSSPWSSSWDQGKNHQQQQQTKTPSFLQFPSSPQSLPVMAKESSQPCRTKVVDLQNAEKKAFSAAPAPNTAVPNSSQKRTAPASVVGWPPIRSFRKNIGSSSSSKPAPDSQNVVPNKIVSEKPVESGKKGLFVKINVDGVPIGRKVDLKAYDSYEKLSSAVDELFRDLLAAQRGSSAGGTHNKQEKERVITGLLDRSGEYTLVYEDNEGDRMLVGDVPWHMFVSTVKRLRVLKSSELSALCFISSKQGKVE